MASIGLIEKFRGYIRETASEMRKVVWPDRRYVIVATVVILIIVLVLGLFITLIDLGFANLMLFLEKAF